MTVEALQTSIAGGSSDHVNKAVGTFVKALVPIDHVCNDCDCLFTVATWYDSTTIELKKQPVPDDIIQKVKDQYLRGIRASISYVWTTISGVITAALFIYCWQTDFAYQKWQEATWFTKAQYVTAYNYGWLFWAFLFIVFLLATMDSYGSQSSKKEEIAKAKVMDLKKFKHSYKHLFVDYPQYN